MKKLGATQKTLLVFGLSLVTISFLLPTPKQSEEVVDLTPKSIVWNQISITPNPNLKIDEIRKDSIVLVSTKARNARLTITTSTNFGTTPDAIVKSFCRSDKCTYSKYTGTRADGAIAKFNVDHEDLQLVLIQSNTNRLWMEYKGPAYAFSEFEDLITTLQEQPDNNRQAI